MCTSKPEQNLFLNIERNGSLMFVLDSFEYQRVDVVSTPPPLSCLVHLIIFTRCLRVIYILIFIIKFSVVIANWGKCSKAVEYRTVNNHLVNNSLMKCHQVCLNPGRWIYRVIQYSNYLINFLITILWFAENGFDVEQNMLNTHS